MPAEIQIMEFDDYQKRPVTIRAAKLDYEVWQRLYENGGIMQIRGHKLEAVKPPMGNKYFNIETLEGTMRANLDDMLIIGVQGEIYACKPDIFEQTYSRPTANATKTVKIQRTRRAFDEIEFTSNIDIKDLTALLEYMKAADVFVKYDIR